MFYSLVCKLSFAIAQRTSQINFCRDGFLHATRTHGLIPPQIDKWSGSGMALRVLLWSTQPTSAKDQWDQWDQWVQ